MDLENLCVQTLELAVEVGEFISNERKQFTESKVESKGLHNYVSYVDTTAEEKIVEGLQILLPEAGFITEEGTINSELKKFNWVIDPLDGTTNFIHGLPPYAVSIALMEDKEVILGIVYEICFKERFYAWKGSKAYLNGKEIRVSRAGKLSNSLIATGFPYTNFEYLDQFMHSMRWFMKNSHGLRRLGSAATDMVYVACGRFEGFYEYGLNPWDVAAATLIIERAGGHNSDFSGGKDYLFGGTIISSNAAIFEEFKNVIYNIMVQKKKI
jgi:myo-inositol-1(or 4)-monophosphatase